MAGSTEKKLVATTYGVTWYCFFVDEDNTLWEVRGKPSDKSPWSEPWEVATPDQPITWVEAGCFKNEIIILFVAGETVFEYRRPQMYYGDHPGWEQHEAPFEGCAISKVSLVISPKQRTALGQMVGNGTVEVANKPIILQSWLKAAEIALDGQSFGACETVDGFSVYTKTLSEGKITHSVYDQSWDLVKSIEWANLSSYEDYSIHVADGPRVFLYNDTEIVECVKEDEGSEVDIQSVAQFSEIPGTCIDVFTAEKIPGLRGFLVYGNSEITRAMFHTTTSGGWQTASDIQP